MPDIGSTKLTASGMAAARKELPPSCHIFATHNGRKIAKQMNTDV
jgi:hypothetical protein